MVSPLMVAETRLVAAGPGSVGGRWVIVVTHALEAHF